MKKRIVNGKIAQTIIVHEFSMFEDYSGELYINNPLWEWKQTVAGKWVMQHAISTPSWQRHMDVRTATFHYKVLAELFEEDAVVFNLKFK